MTLELRFPVNGVLIPSDHGYALFAALSRQIPAFHESSEVAFDTLAGTIQKNGLTWLKQEARLKIRVPQLLVSSALKLAYQQLRLGTYPIRLGMPQIVTLQPSSSLYARNVTIKNHQEAESFHAAVFTKLEAENIQAEIEVGQRRVVKIGGHTIVGFSLFLHQLSHENSLRLLQLGLGGRRHVGCGYFHRIHRTRPALPCANNESQEVKI